MPESVRDRCTKAHEYIFLMSKKPKYYYDAEAIKEDQADYERQRCLRERECGLDSVYELRRDGNTGQTDQSESGAVRNVQRRGELAMEGTRNKRSVWTVATKPFSGWTQTYHLVRVGQDAPCDDTMRIMSPDCPLHAGCPDRVPSAFYDERVVGELIRILRKHSRHVPSQLSDSETVDWLRKHCSLVDNLGSPAQSCSGSANQHNKQSRKTGLVPETILPCKPCDETAGHIACMSKLPVSAGPQNCTGENNTLLDGMAAHLLDQTHNGTAGKSSCSLSPKCACELYTIEAQKTSHFATFPPDLIRPCILAGCPGGGIVLDPFFGAGTTGVVARELGRKHIGIELNEEYAEMARVRIRNTDRALFAGTP